MIETLNNYIERSLTEDIDRYTEYILLSNNYNTPRLNFDVYLWIENNPVIVLQSADLPLNMEIYEFIALVALVKLSDKLCKS